MRSTTLSSRHNTMWAIDRLTRYGANWKTVKTLVEAGVGGITVETELHTCTTLVRLILQNNRGHPVRIAEGMNPSDSDKLFENAIGPCILLASLPPVDSKEKP